jgi:hypothetical protein
MVLLVADARRLPISEPMVDLTVTSPSYALDVAHVPAPQ